eukprot:scpid89780/ scgid27236/ 
MACPLRAAARSFALPFQGCSSLSVLPRRLCSSAVEETVTPEIVDVRDVTTSPAGGLNVPTGEQFTKQIQPALQELQIPEEHSTKLRRALTDRTFNEAIFLSRRKAGNRKEVLEADLHNVRYATLGNTIINFVLTEKLLQSPQFQLNMHGVQELCYILMHPEKVHTLLPNLNIDSYVRTQDGNLTDVSRTTAVQAVVGCLVDTKGRQASIQCVRDNMVELDVSECHRLIKLNHPKLCLMQALQRNGLPPPVLRVTGGQSDTVLTHIVSGDRVLAEVPTSMSVSQDQQHHIACQRALVDHFQRELADLPVPHSSTESSEDLQFRKENELNLAYEGEKSDYTEPSWKTRA